MTYYKSNKRSIIEKQKQYRKDNLEYVKDTQRIWYQQNRYHIKCTICQVRYIAHNEKNHFKTKRHHRALYGVRPKNSKTKQNDIEQEKEIEKIVPYKTIFVKKNIITWILPETTAKEI